MLVCLQVSYDLLSALNSGMETLVTGPSTNPQTLASALTAFRATLPLQASTNTLITELPKYIVSLLLHVCIELYGPSAPLHLMRYNVYAHSWAFN